MSDRALNCEAVLIPEAVQEIRSLYATSMVSQAALAEYYRVSQRTICSIVRGETWRDVDGPITRRGQKRVVHLLVRTGRPRCGAPKNPRLIMTTSLSETTCGGCLSKTRPQ